MSSINITNRSNNILDLLKLLHTTHPTHPDGTPSLWTICVSDDDRLDDLTFCNYQLHVLKFCMDWASTDCKIDRSHYGTVVYTFKTEDGDKDEFTLYTDKNYVQSLKYYFHADEWKNHFG